MTPKRKLIRLSLSNIDLVGAPANPESWVALFKADVPILKVDQDKRRVWGWASVAIDKSGADVVDSQGDTIDADALEEASVEFMLDSRASGVNHDGKPPVGRVFEALYMSAEKSKAMGLPPGPVPTGLWIGVQVDDDATWSKVKQGTLPAFSIEGQAQAEDVGKSDGRRFLKADGTMDMEAARKALAARQAQPAQRSDWRADAALVAKYEAERAEVAKSLGSRHA